MHKMAAQILGAAVGGAQVENLQEMAAQEL
jgi:hypothetical protein